MYYILQIPFTGRLCFTVSFFGALIIPKPISSLPVLGILKKAGVPKKNLRPELFGEIRCSMNG